MNKKAINSISLYHFITHFLTNLLLTMKKHTIVVKILYCLLVITQYTFAQPYSTGVRNLNLLHPTTNDTVPTQVYFPTILGVPIVGTASPLIVFGNGMAIHPSAYIHLADTLSRRGCIVALPLLEFECPPDQTALSLDIETVVNGMLALNSTDDSEFYNTLNVNAIALIGHSMGASAIVQAAANMGNISTIILLAPSDLEESATILAASMVTIPALFVTSMEDLIAPIADNHQPIYDALASTEKQHISLSNACHCGFADRNEASAPCFSLENAKRMALNMPFFTKTEWEAKITAQHDSLYAVLFPWLEYYLKGNGLNLQIKLFLEGAYQEATGLMTTTLQDCHLIPLEQPYNRPPWGYLGIEKLDSTNQIPAETVDWILIELRDGIDNNQIIERRVALLQSDGSVVGIDTVTNTIVNEGVPFYNIQVNIPYYIVVRHRNHLAIMSEQTVTIPNIEAYDYTIPTNIMGEGQVSNLGNGNWGMCAGDFNSDGVITVADNNLYASQAALLNMYVDGDCNLDKNVTVHDFNYYFPNTSILGISQIRY